MPTIDDIDGILSGEQWDDAQLTYRFPAGAAEYNAIFLQLGLAGSYESIAGHELEGTVAAFDATQRQMALDALQAWANVADLRFSPEPAYGLGNIRFAFTSSVSSGEYAHAYLPGQAAGGDIWVNSGLRDTIFADGSPGGMGLFTLVHEIGHALGLKHPFDGEPILAEGTATTKYTVMAYADYPGALTIDAADFKPTTPMLLDIAAIQSLYGANMSYHSGDDLYLFDEGHSYYQTIWDAGGIDLIQWQGTSGVEIDLRAGEFSQLGNPITFGGLAPAQKDTVAIAYGVTIEEAAGGSGNDTLLGNAAANILDGGLGDDMLVGAAGDDALKGDAGIDVMIGGAGNDLYVVFDSDDTVIEAAGAGIDTVNALISYQLGPNLENLALFGAAAVAGTGNALANELDGRNLTANVLSGGAGNDTYYLDADDTVVEHPHEGFDIVKVQVSYVLGPNLEGLVLLGGTPLALAATGNELNNSLVGNALDNVLDGGAGNDTMAGDTGNDTYYVDSSGDRVIESDASGGVDQVFSEVSFTLGANVENLTLTGPDAIHGIGNGGANELVARGSTDNMLSGGAGNDVLQGGRGEDVMMGGTGNDAYYVNRGDGAGVAKTGAEEDQVIEAAGAGIDTVHSSVYTYLLDANVENLVLEGVARRGYGNALDNEITGNERNNFLFGGAGDDTLNGGSGVDTLTGGTGEDAFVFDNTANIDRVMDFVAGEDSLVLSHATFSGIGTVGSFDANALVLGSSALDAADRILYDSASGALYYDHDGAGGDTAVQFATIVGAPELTAADIAVVA
jgi:serralysin